MELERSFQRPRTFLLFSAFFVGCMATLLQVILFREQMVLLEGNELLLSLMLFGWLVGIASGALLTRYCFVENHIGGWLFAGLILLPGLLWGCTLSIRLMPWVWAIPAQEAFSPLQMIGISLLSALPASLVVGFLFPLLATALKGVSPDSADSSAIAQIFRIEAYGSVLGGILLLLKIVPRWSPFDIGMVSILGILLLTLLRVRSSGIRKLGASLLFLVFIGMGAGIPARVNEWSAAIRWETRHSGYRFVRALETPYQRLDLGERDEQYTVFGNGSSLFSYPDEFHHSQWAFMSLSQSPHPQKILFFGSGGAEFYPSYTSHQPQEYTIVELDIGVERIVKDRIDSLIHNRTRSTEVRWIHTDAIRYSAAKTGNRDFDLIAIKQPDPTNAVINRYYTREFFHSIRKSMADDGVIVFTVTGTPNYEMGDVGLICGTLYWTLRDVFPNVLVVPGAEWWFFASPKRPLLSDPQAIIERFKQNRSPVANFSPEIYSIYYDTARIQAIQNAFQAYKPLPRNRDSRPLCYLYNLLMWSKQYGYFKDLPVASLAFSGSWLVGIGLISVLLIGFMALVSIRVLVPRSQKWAATPLAVLLLAGLSSLSAEIAILLYFQSRVGYLYQHIGIFFGIFMLGLAFGTSDRIRLRTSNKDRDSSRLMRTVLSFTLLLFLTPTVFSVGLNPMRDLFFGLTESMLWIWLAILAFFMGRIILHVARVVEGQGSGLTSMAGWMDACDCLGGALGALLTGLFFVPMIGLLNLFYVLAGFNGLSLLLLWRWQRRNAP